MQLFLCAESLGAVESLAESPALMTHASVPPEQVRTFILYVFADSVNVSSPSNEQRARLGISDALVRLSVGVEDVADLKADVQQALDKALSVTPEGQS